MRLWPRMTAEAFATILAAGFWATPMVAASTQVRMAENSVSTFAAQAQAEAFLSKALPTATAANPKYRTPGTDYDRRWLIKTVAFSRADDGGVVVSLGEDFDDYRNGALVSRGSHQARFALREVAISVETADDLSEHGQKAQGILFRCLGAPCVHAVWDGKPSVSARTDIYIQDAAERQKILSALQALQKKGASR